MMFPNHIVKSNFEEQSRSRIQREAEISRQLHSINKKDARTWKFPKWEFSLRKFRIFRLGDSHAS